MSNWFYLRQKKPHRFEHSVAFLHKHKFAGHSRMLRFACISAVMCRRRLPKEEFYEWNFSMTLGLLIDTNAFRVSTNIHTQTDTSQHTITRRTSVLAPSYRFAPPQHHIRATSPVSATVYRNRIVHNMENTAAQCGKLPIATTKSVQTLRLCFAVISTILFFLRFYWMKEKYVRSKQIKWTSLQFHEK